MSTSAATANYKALYVPQDVHKKLKIWCARNDVRLSDAVAPMVEEYLRKNP